MKIFYVVVVFVVLGCSGRGEKKFRRVPSAESGITFRNTLSETLEFNIFNYLYFYNGGGVAIGDVNGDALPDIFFTANQAPDKLYLNQGGLRFRDVSETAGIEGFNGWTTGVTMADVNSDGKLDVYVGYLGDYLIYKGRNQLFINEGNDANGVPKFTDRAMEYGLDLVGFSTQAAFFDYDRDGDLDMYMLNHSVHANGTFANAGLRGKKHPLAGDRLLRNDDGHFSDITQEAGIYSSALGYGLGIAVSDINLDGWPDIYVGNDFHENDYLYINQGDGTFKERLGTAMAHTSRYTMGVDVADFNNDAFPDLMSTDMLSEDPLVLKSSQAEDTYDMYNFKINFGYHHQFARNALQLNNQDGNFSEIALLAGVPATDWSWSALFSDYDLDGWKDIFISNGVYRRFNDLDYINFISLDSIQRKMQDELHEQDMVYIEKMPRIKVPNYLYRNNADSTFTNQAEAWGLDEASYSNGSAYADLDNDGDLDLVVNNIADEAFVYENTTLSKTKVTPRNRPPHYLQIRLQGKDGNLRGIGAKIFLYAGNNVQLQECMPTRGYQSSVDDRLTFGTGATSNIDSIVVVWNDGTFQTLVDIKADQQLVLHQQEAGGVFDYSRFHPIQTILTNRDDVLQIPYRHHENTSFVEFNREQLIPHMMSTEGPGAAVGDVNGDGKEDIFLGGAKWKSGSILVQGKDGKFASVSQPALEKDSTFEDVDAFFFDADGDQDNDLFVVSGGNEFSGNSSYRDPRLYLNDGRGNLTRSSGLPNLKLTGSAAA
ncbi:MAG TPA: VCBS repeat-containing protein, partial [Ohtaekwangia sp.]|nr:VCBS repeat-containing protein [Ohtaekwangia sp.]